MPYFKTSQEWLDQSALLLQARPATTKITTRYSLEPAPASTKPDDDGAPRPPRGSLEVKTYDPASGTTLKYRTTKAAEVSRLIYASLGRLGRGMAAVPDIPEEPMPDAPAEVEDQKPAAAAAAAPAPAAQQQPPQQSGGGKKKKKGKK